MNNLARRELMAKYNISSNDLDHMAASWYTGDLDDPLDYVSSYVKSATKAERKALEDIVKARTQQLKHFFYTTCYPDQVADFLAILTDELDPHSGLNDQTELALIRSICDKIRRQGSEPDLTPTEYKWLKEYMSR